MVFGVGGVGGYFYLLNIEEGQIYSFLTYETLLSSGGGGSSGIFFI